MNNKGFYLIVAILMIGMLTIGYSLIYNRTPLADVAELVPVEQEPNNYASSTQWRHNEHEVQIEKVSTPLN